MTMAGIVETAPIPVQFLAPRWMRAMNVIAVAGAIAACTSALLMGMGHLGVDWGLLSGGPTFVVGLAWAVLLRWEKQADLLRVRWGWIASVPLAAINAALAAGLTEAVDMGRGFSAMVTSFGLYGLVGATFGAFIWGPALVAVLVVFGIPIWVSQRNARLGLAGEERGERLIGIVAATFGVLALGVAFVMRTYAPVVDTGPMIGLLGEIGFFASATLAIACGAGAATWATAREKRRRDFVRRVEAGEEPGFRIAATRAGKVLLRVASAATYRTQEQSETVFEQHDGESDTFTQRARER